MQQNVKSTEEALSILLGTRNFEKVECIQSLWSGYGDISKYRFTLPSSNANNDPHFVVKHICPPKDVTHPRGWTSSVSHQRKLDSYQVEINFYRHWAKACNQHCRVPTLLAQTSFTTGTELTHLIVMSDLNSQGFSARASTLTIQQTKLCLAWLANFHAIFLTASTNEKPDGLWPIGTYWHLATRQEEWHSMPDSELKAKAVRIDNLLNNCKYNTLVHGDAKVANFCFNENFTDVAAVDFQYVGNGVGVKDVIYLLGSCLTEQECAHNFAELLNEYFTLLTQAINLYQPNIDADAVIYEWRKLVDLAWADFERFLVGWAPTHSKRNQFSNNITEAALNSLS
ncbi:oxidoreductase family protein [Shewanella sp. 125m-7]